MICVNSNEKEPIALEYFINFPASYSLASFRSLILRDFSNQLN